ncbi:MAG: carboxylating nicotinate-nucleotide diphosphorylase [Dissulfurimicrobium sp.]|uniref:carboxylating nicotinate-nucleotide diphosphorylase n=1 Tax=Dissulfurimicrobium TaxID=1769732 RepID=UPI003C794E6D
MDRRFYEGIVAQALREDIGHGDITTSLCVPRDVKGRAVVVAKEDCVVAGIFVAEEAFLQCDPDCSFPMALNEGARANSGDVVMEIQGSLQAILQAERTALNFLQRLCGIATLTRHFVEKIGDLPCRLVDTRKTTPCLRVLEKYAVRAGGGFNHRYGLSDGILIKDNHIAACGSIKEALSKVRASCPHTLKIEIEVSTLDELKEAIDAGADAVLLDNMDVKTLTEAVAMARGLKPGLLLEASGGVCLENVRDVAGTGVDIVSAGALTHSARAVDLSLRVIRFAFADGHCLTPSSSASSRGSESSSTCN